MKTNEVPEKLYLSDIQRYFDDTDKTISTIKYADDDIEYTRTDAFIEKACEWLEKNIAELTGIDSYAITESFKQAMEKQLMNLIDKDAVDTILRKLWKKDNGFSNSARYAYNGALQDIQCEIDTIEVKEVDLDEEVKKCLKQHSMLAVGKKDFTEIAKHFFELGLKVAHKVE